MAGVSRERIVYRASWSAVIVAFFIVVGIGVASVVGVLTPSPRLAPIRQATSDLLKVLANTVFETPTASDSGQICPVGKATGVTVESGTGKIIAIHC